MNQQFSETRVELTALAWLHLATEALQKASKAQGEGANLKRQAGESLSLAMLDIERRVIGSVR